jgi:hypothetical protein
VNRGRGLHAFAARQSGLAFRISGRRESMAPGAKHIVAAGIVRVVYIEPYPKSKAAEFHDDAICLGFSDGSDLVHFEPFVGVGPRRFFDLFSIRLGTGIPLKRKDDAGKVVSWNPESSKLRIQMLPASYLDLEKLAASLFQTFKKKRAGAS